MGYVCTLHYISIYTFEIEKNMHKTLRTYIIDVFSENTNAVNNFSKYLRMCKNVV